jgi:hypothetical protein
VTIYPTVDIALAVHARLIEKFGGSLGGRERRALEYAFLKVNGHRLAFDDLEAYSFLIGLYESGTFRMGQLESWLRNHISDSPLTRFPKPVLAVLAA